MTERKFLIYLSVVIIIAAGALLAIEQRTKYVDIKIGDRIIKAEVADTFAKRKKGLSGRDGLEKGEGMIFLFGQSGKYGFWMNEMKFPIDIVWINDNKIVDILPAISPEDQKIVYYPLEDVNCVLELPANFTKENDLQIGKEILLDKK